MRLALLFCTLLILTACQTAPKDAGFGDVDREVYSRTQQHITWNTDHRIDAATQSVLDADLTPDSAVQLALLYNPSLQATYEELNISQADLVHAGLLKNPVFSASIRFPARPHYGVDLGIEEEFVDLLFLLSRQKTAQLLLDQTKLKTADQVLDVAADVRRTYYHLLGARQLLLTQQQTLDAAQASFDAAKNFHDAGNLRDLDLDNQQADLSRAQLAYDDAQLEVTESREHFLRLMGIHLANVHLPAGLPTLPPSEQDEITLEKIALTQRLDIRIAQSQIDLLKQTLGTARFASLLSGGSTGAELVRDPDIKTTIGPKISLPIPIFDQGQPAVDRAAAQVRQASDELLSTQQNASSEIRVACARLAVLHARVQYLHQTVIPLRTRITEETLRQYNGMLIGVFDLLHAKQSELDSQTDYVQTLQHYWEARADLEKALGGPLPEPTARIPTTQGANP